MHGTRPGHAYDAAMPPPVELLRFGAVTVNVTGPPAQLLTSFPPRAYRPFILSVEANEMKLALAIAVCLAGAVVARARTTVVTPGQSIQAALDAASEGDRIVVRPGTYHESGATRALTITKSGIHLVATPGRGKPVVIEQAGTQTQGIWASPPDTLEPADVELPPCGVAGTRLHDIEVSGFTVQDFEGFGIYLACVDGFRIRGNTSQHNDTYAIFPVRSSKGRMTGNTSSGTLTDACLYVGQDDDIVVDHNQATSCQIGFQIENSTNVRWSHNVAKQNTAGMIVDIINGRQATTVSDNLVIGNVLADNNRPNSAPVGADTHDILPGIGLVIDGAQRTTVKGNVIEQNHLAGMTIVDFCLDRADICAAGPLDIEPNPNDTVVTRNRFAMNATDVIFAPAGGQGNCFSNNRPKELASANPLPSCSR
jgi:nitrous oxidase accessory protein NosD